MEPPFYVIRTAAAFGVRYLQQVCCGCGRGAPEVEYITRAVTIRDPKVPYDCGCRGWRSRNFVCLPPRFRKRLEMWQLVAQRLPLHKDVVRLISSYVVGDIQLMPAAKLCSPVLTRRYSQKKKKKKKMTDKEAQQLINSMIQAGALMLFLVTVLVYYS